MSTFDDAAKNALAFASGPAIKLILGWLSMPKVAGIPIECTSYKELCTSDVSRMPVISPTGADTTGKNYLTDNIAPKPIVWELQGYLGASFLEPSALSLVLQPSLINKRNVLKNAWLKRFPVDFQPLNRNFDLLTVGPGIKVAIEKLEFDTRPDVMNKIPVSMTLVQVPFLTITNGVQAVKNAATGAGNAIGVLKDFGASIAKIVQ